MHCWWRKNHRMGLIIVVGNSPHWRRKGPESFMRGVSGKCSPPLAFLTMQVPASLCYAFSGLFGNIKPRYSRKTKQGRDVTSSLRDPQGWADGGGESPSSFSAGHCLPPVLKGNSSLMRGIFNMWNSIWNSILFKCILFKCKLEDW